MRCLGLAGFGLIACTIANPEFGLDASGSGGSSSATTGGSTGGSNADTGESTGSVGCGFADVPEFELSLEQDGTELPAMCGAQAHTITVIETASDALTYHACDDACPCGEGSTYRLVFDNLSLPQLTVPPDGCMHMVIERSDACEVTGFVLGPPPESADEGPEFVVVQQLDRGPEGLARPLPDFGYEPVSPCACSDCCDASGTYALVIGGVRIAEGTTSKVPAPTFGARSMAVTNLASHVDEACAPSKLWTATNLGH